MEVVLAQTSEVDWPNVVRLKVGAVLLELLRRCALVHIDPATHRLMEEEGIYVSDGAGASFSSTPNSSNSSGNNNNNSSGMSSSSGGSSTSGSDSDSAQGLSPAIGENRIHLSQAPFPTQHLSPKPPPKQTLCVALPEFPSVKEPVIPLFRSQESDMGDWVVGSPLSKGNPRGGSKFEPRLNTQQRVDAEGGGSGADTLFFSHRARLLGKALSQPLVSPAGVLLGSSRLPGGSRGTTGKLLQGGEFFWGGATNFPFYFY